MASIKTLLYDAVKDVAGGRISPNRAPDDVTPPYGVFFKPGGRPSNVLDAQAAGIERHHFQFDLYATGYLAADALHQELKAAMATASALGAIEISDRDMFDTEAKLHRVISEWVIWAA